MGKRSREKRERRLGGEIQPKEEKEEGITSILKEIIRWATYLILFIPLIISGQYFFPFVGPKSIYFMGLVELIFAAWLFLIVFSPKYRPRLNILSIALILFLVVLTFSTFFGADISRSFWSKYERMTGLLMWFHLFAFFLAISSTFKSKEDWFKIFGVSIFAAILMSLISLVVKASPNAAGMLAASRGGATIGNSSFLGTYLLFNIFLALYLLLQSRGRDARVLREAETPVLGLKVYSGISLAIIALALLLSGARAAILSVAGGLVLLFLFWLIFCKKGSLKLAGIALLLIFAIGVLGLIYFSLQPGNFVYQKLVQMASKSRIVVWQIAWKGFLEKPWLGWGPENFELAFTEHFDPRLFLQEYGGEIWFDRAHNIIFDTLVASGIFGLVFYLGIFIATFYILLKKFLQQRIGFPILGIFSVILISYFVQNLTVFDMVNSYLMFFLILGFIARLPAPEAAGFGGQGSFTSQKEISPFGRYQKVGSFKKSLVVIILIFFCFSFFKFVIQPIRTDAGVIDAIRSPSPTERVSLYKKTLDTSPVGKYQIREMFADTAINFIRQGSEAATKVSLGDLKLELDFVKEELEKSIKESPLDFRAELKLGQVYNVYSQIDPSKIPQAETILEKALELSPTNQQAYWELAQTRLYQGKFDEALSLAEKAVELEPRIINSHLIVVQVAKIMGNGELAKKKAEEAIKINPAWEPEFKKILEK